MSVSASDKLFPYPLPKTLDIGVLDPMDFQFDTGCQEWVYRPGWWRKLGSGTKLALAERRQAFFFLVRR
ncbi:MAG: hypothetical protein H0Z39_07145 [Peptococcaceae bacterium]|nr:hypothetical protein [Peptococcaceae bacterium]